MKKSWSHCSLDYLRKGLQKGLGNCLMNVPEASTLVGGPRCGNEIIEMGEECDCGSVDDCTRLFTEFLYKLISYSISLNLNKLRT